MGEEKKEDGGNATEENKEKESSEVDETIVIKVDVHCRCEACAKKVVRSLRGFQGVEDVAVDWKENMVAIKGKSVDPIKLCERIQQKTGRKVQLISPLPKPPEDQPKDENKEAQKDEQNKDQPPPAVTVVLRVQMHCEACAQRLRKCIRKVKGVESVETNVASGQVIVKGVIADPENLAKYVHKRTKKQVFIVKDDDKKEENQEKTEEDQKAAAVQEEEKKDNEQGVKNEEAKMMMMMVDEMNKYDYHEPTARYNYMEYHYDPNNLNNYHPQIFSDENPNACSIM